MTIEQASTYRPNHAGTMPAADPFDPRQSLRLPGRIFKECIDGAQQLPINLFCILGHFLLPVALRIQGISSKLIFFLHEVISEIPELP